MLSHDRALGWVSRASLLEVGTDSKGAQRPNWPFTSRGSLCWARRRGLRVSASRRSGTATPSMDTSRERERPSQLSTRGSRGAIQVPWTSGRACGRRLSLILIGLGDEPVFLFACTDACFLSGPLSQLLSASGPASEPHSPVIVMAALYIITHSLPSSMHIFGAAFPLTRAVRMPFSFPFLPCPAWPRFGTKAPGIFAFLIPEVHVVVSVALLSSEVRLVK